MNAAVNKAADLYQAEDPSLTRDEARTLGAYSLIGTGVLAQGTVVAKQLIKIAGGILLILFLM